MARQIDNSLIRAPGTVLELTDEQMVEWFKCATDPIYFANNYCKAQHPTKGPVPFKLFDYQTRLMNAYHKYGQVICMASRQLGKSQTSAAYILWRAMFSESQTILIAAHVHRQALEIVHRISYIYETIPLWLKQGIIIYNKGSMEFENGSRILSATTTENTGRGLSISLLYIDELAAVKPRIANEFWTSIQPTLSTGGDCIITSTPMSDEDLFAQIWTGANNRFDDFGNELIDSVGSNGFFPIKILWKEHPDRDEAWAQEQRNKIGDIKFSREFDCEFLQGDETLIDPLALKNLKGIDPIETINNVRWYEKIKPNRTYIIGLDPSTGTGGDPAAIQILQMPEMIQIGEWRNNKTPIKGQIDVLYKILKRIDSELKNNLDHVGERSIYWSIENNACGEAALSIISETGEHNFPGYFISEPNKGRSGRKGLFTSNKSKLLACSKLKSLIESNKIDIRSKNLISELKGYVRTGVGFKGKYGYTDDLVSSMLIVIRLILAVSKYDDNFSQISDTILNEEDIIAPMPITFLF